MPSLNVTFTGNSRQLQAELARVEAMVFGVQKKINARGPAASLSNIGANQAEMAALYATVGKRNGVAMMTAEESSIKDQLVRSVEVEEITRSNLARRLWRQRGMQRAEAELAGEVEVATRSNQARALWRQRAETRLSTAVSAEQAAGSGSMFWFSGSAGKEAKAAATAERVAAEARLANLTSTAYAATMVGKAMSGAAHGAQSMTGAIRETIVIFREMAAGRGISRIISSATLLGQYLWRGFLTALLSIPGMIAVAGAAIYYFTYQHLKKLNEAMDKTAESMNKTFGSRAHANVDVMMEAARAAGTYREHIKELGEAHETLADQMKESLQAMDDEYQMMRKIAQLKGETPAQEMAAEQDFRRRKLDLINKTLEKQKQVAADAKAADDAAEQAAFASDEAKNRNARLKDMPNQLHEAEQLLDKYKKIKEELEPVVENEVKYSRSDSERAAQPGIQRMTKDGEYHSLEEVSRYVDAYQKFINELPGKMAELEEIQRELASEQSKAASGDTKAADDVIALQKERKKLMDEIGIHEKYDSATSALEGRGGNSRASLTANQQIGAFAMPQQTTMIDLTKQIVRNTNEMNGKLQKISFTSDTSGYPD